MWITSQSIPNWDVHVIPDNGGREHIELRVCWCNPRVTLTDEENKEARDIRNPRAMVVVHNDDANGISELENVITDL